MRSHLRILKSRTIYKGKVLDLKVDRIIEPGGIKAVREVVHHWGSVVVLPHLPDGRILLVRQYRYPARQSLWELVAGRIERGESPRQAAVRELIEETGHRARRVRPVFDFYPSPGLLTERMYLVEARGLQRTQARPEEDERIRIGRFTRAQLRKLVRSKKIKDGKTLVGLLWLLKSFR